MADTRCYVDANGAIVMVDTLVPENFLLNTKDGWTQIAILGASDGGAREVHDEYVLHASVAAAIKEIARVPHG